MTNDSARSIEKGSLPCNLWYHVGVNWRQGGFTAGNAKRAKRPAMTGLSEGTKQHSVAGGTSFEGDAYRKAILHNNPETLVFKLHPYEAMRSTPCIDLIGLLFISAPYRDVLLSIDKGSSAIAILVLSTYM